MRLLCLLVFSVFGLMAQTIDVLTQTKTGPQTQPRAATVTPSATPVFDLSKGMVQNLVIGQTVTAQTITNGIAGQFFIVHLCENGTGGFAWTWATAVFKGGMVLTTTALKCNVQVFWYDGSVAWAISTGVTNL